MNTVNIIFFIFTITTPHSTFPTEGIVYAKEQDHSIKRNKPDGIVLPADNQMINFKG